MKRYFVLFTFLVFIVVGLVSGLTLASCSKDAGGSGSSTVANPFVGNTYKDLRVGKDEKDFWYFKSETDVYWGDMDYKYTFTDTTLTLTRRGYHVYDLDYHFNEDKSVLYIGSPIYGEYTKQ